jgi:hypothetical protein
MPTSVCAIAVCASNARRIVKTSVYMALSSKFGMHGPSPLRLATPRRKSTYFQQGLATQRYALQQALALQSLTRRILDAVDR